MGGGGWFHVPEVWSPAGGWWATPKNWKVNTGLGESEWDEWDEWGVGSGVS